MSTQTILQPSPLRNDSVIGASVYSHSGEFSPKTTDVDIPGRGISFQFIRKYHSGHTDKVGQLGRGWTFQYAKRIERYAEEVIYSDGSGNEHLFTRHTENRTYQSPGMYAILMEEGNQWSLRQRYGSVLVFENPESGGRLLSIADRNGNTLRFEHTPDLLRVTDTLDRVEEICLEQGRVVRVQDHSGRVWQYQYDSNDCLISVTHPATAEMPQGRVVPYRYNQMFQLVSITDPNDQTYLENRYDTQGRVTWQKHGNGVNQFEYEPIGVGAEGFQILRTKACLKNGARLELTHDADGHVIERKFYVEASSLAKEDRNGFANEVPLTTLSKFNRFGELIARTFPAGNRTEWDFDDEQSNPLVQGNMLLVKRIPAAEVASDQELLITRYAYEPQFQRRKSITNARGQTIIFTYDARGNLIQKQYPPVTVQVVDETSTAGQHTTRTTVLKETFEYNRGGQLLRVVDARGAETEFYYYPAAFPAGEKGRRSAKNKPQELGGYLARILRDPAKPGRTLPGKAAHLLTELSYDAVGNITTIWDGRGNPTKIQYNSQNKPIRVTGRAPLNHQVQIQYDANGNPLQSSLSFDRKVFDQVKKRIVEETTAISERLEYDMLGLMTRRITSAEGRDVVEVFVRDENENIVRKIQPMGNVTEYRYDARNLLLERRMGVGTAEETSTHYTYTPNGRRRSTTDGLGHTVHFSYDGFHRYVGFTNAVGTTKKQWRDANGNVTRMEVSGDLGLVNEDGESADPQVVPLLETQYHYDELNRMVKVDRAWRDPSTGESLGNGRWSGEDGLVSTVVEYGDNSLPAKVWYEAGNIINMVYDGANRMIAASDQTGESISSTFDKNGNRVKIERLGPQVGPDEERFQQVIVQKFDGLDRLVSRSINDEPPDLFEYNAMGQLVGQKFGAGTEVQYLHDEFGRRIGQVSVLETSENGGTTKNLLMEHVQVDDNNRVTARINPSGEQTKFLYDGLNRQSGVIFPNGTSRYYKRDKNGNIVRILDGNRKAVEHRFDAANRLIERRVDSNDGGQPVIEQFQFDGLSRVTAAVTPGSKIIRKYDSLTHILQEKQNGHTIYYQYDAAGNRTNIDYPGGLEVRKKYDQMRRVTDVLEGRDHLVTSYTYRSSRQLLGQQIGDVLEASFAYQPCQGCIREVAYRTKQDGRLVEGSRYQYDASGNMTAEIKLNKGDAFGERYQYDSLNRLTGVQYGVEDVNDMASNFKQEVQYDLSPMQTWNTKTVKDASGNVIETLEGKINPRGAYTSLGSRRYEYDSNGNRILEQDEESAGFAEKRSTYDHANRLIKMECLDGDGNIVKTIGYSYDAFSRQVSKRVQDAQGTREIQRVWNGRQLIEEWENGRLSRSYIYGRRANEPVQMISHTPDGLEKYFYTYNGRGLVTGLANEAGEMVERYNFDVAGMPFLSEFQGQEMDDLMNASRLGNEFFHGGQIWDSDVEESFGLGSAKDPWTGQKMNPEGGGGQDCGNEYNASIVPGDIASTDATDAGIAYGVGLITVGTAMIGVGGVVAAVGISALAAASLGVLAAGFVIAVGGALIIGGIMVAMDGVETLQEERDRAREREAQEREEESSSEGTSGSPCPGSGGNGMLFSAGIASGPSARPPEARPAGDDPEEGGEPGGEEGDGSTEGGPDPDGGEESETATPRGGCSDGGASTTTSASPDAPGGTNDWGAFTNAYRRQSSSGFKGSRGVGSAGASGCTPVQTADSALGRGKKGTSSAGGCSGGSVRGVASMDEGGNGSACGSLIPNGLQKLVSGWDPVSPLFSTVGPGAMPNSVDSLGMMQTGPILIPTGLETNPSPEDLGRGVGDGRRTSFDPEDSGVTQVNPKPEASAGTCGGGDGRGVSPMSCSRF